MLASFCDAPGWETVWADEFDGARLDGSKWGAVVSDAMPPARMLRFGAASPHADCRGYGCVLLGACRDAACAEENVYVSGGRLVLRSERRELHGRTLATGAVSTWGRAAWRASDGPFRVCISATLPGDASGGGRAQGLWPAHWMMPHDDSCDPDEGEMDIMEMVNGVPVGYSTYHWQDSYPAARCAFPANHSHGRADV